MKGLRTEAQHLDSRPTYPDFEWAKLGSQVYWDAITDSNESYRKMLNIGKSHDAFKVAKEGVSTMLTAKAKDEFKKAKGNIKNGIPLT